MADQKTVLFIEDDPDQRKMYSFAFKRAGIRFIEAPSGEEGIVVAEREKPDVILLDLLMNGIGGIETLSRIKNNQLIPETPIIVFTNYTKEDVLKKAEEIGAAEIIIKTDVVPHELVERLQRKYLK